MAAQSDHDKYSFHNIRKEIFPLLQEAMKKVAQWRLSFWTRCLVTRKSRAIR